MKRITKITAIFLTVIMLTSVIPFTVFADTDHRTIYEETLEYISTLGTPTVGSVGGEWMVIDLTRSGYCCPEGYYENVVEYVNSKINEKGQLHKSKSTDNSRVILALTSAGYDVTDVAGHNLLVGLTDMTYVKKQGINGPIWALIAFDCNGYDIPENPDATEQVSREGLISFILSKQLEDGGWALSGKNADTDMTGMAIQSLAPYYQRNEAVKEAVDRGVVRLSELQKDDGGYGSIDGICSESCAQVIVALTTLGINPHTDPRFVKNGVSVVDAMCSFAIEGGGFAHNPGAALNGMATEQATYALAAYFRFLEGKTSLYDMSDVVIGDGELLPPEDDTTSRDTTATEDTTASEDTTVDTDTTLPEDTTTEEETTGSDDTTVTKGTDTKDTPDETKGSVTADKAKVTTAKTANKVTVTTKKAVTKPSEAGQSAPQTSDNASIIFYAVMLAMSVILMIAFNKRKNYNR